MDAPNLPFAFSRRQAQELGISDYRLAGLVRRGVLVRERRGVYARVRGNDRRAEHLAVARAVMDGFSVPVALSHLTAAAAHGLPLPLARIRDVHLTILSGTPRTRRPPGCVLHHANSYDTAVCVIDGVLVTDPARTVADCLRVVGARVSVPIADAALHSGLVSRDDLLAAMEMQCHWPGRHRVESARPIVDGRRESWLESYAAVRFDEWGIEQPTPQVEVRDEAGLFVARTDACWLADATVLELDGRAKYTLAADPQRAWEAEKERFDRLGNLGLERVRFGLGDLLNQPQIVQRRISDRRHHGSRRRFSGEFRLRSSSGLTLL